MYTERIMKGIRRLTIPAVVLKDIQSSKPLLGSFPYAEDETIRIWNDRNADADLDTKVL
jgi:hypothetical protein